MVRHTLSSSVLSAVMLVSCEASSERTTQKLRIPPGDAAGNEVLKLPRRHPLQNQHSRLMNNEKRLKKGNIGGVKQQQRGEGDQLTRTRSRRAEGRLTRQRGSQHLETKRVEEANSTIQRDSAMQRRSGENTRWRRIAQSKPTCPDEWELRGPSDGYTEGDVISAPKSRGSNDGLVFSCKPWPMSGHCNQRGFEPMVDSA